MTNIELLTPDKIIKSKRKSITLIIKNDGEFVVRAPINCSDKDILNFINQKAEWIIKKRVEQKQNSIQPLKMVNGEQISLFGNEYVIELKDVFKVKIVENLIIVPTANSKQKFINFLKKQTKKHIEERAKLIAELFGFEYLKISISSAKTCWGSCSFNNNLHFTFKLAFCPLDVIDYIILHELCHTKCKNHSTKFWQLVEHCMPNYKTQEKWLKKNRGIINII